VRGSFGHAHTRGPALFRVHGAPGTVPERHGPGGVDPGGSETEGEKNVNPHEHAPPVRWFLSGACPGIGQVSHELAPPPKGPPQTIFTPDPEEPGGVQMAHQEVAMWEILNVLERTGRGETQTAVSHVTGHCRKTIRRYVRTAGALGWMGGVDPPSEALAAEVFTGVYTSRRPGQRVRRGSIQAQPEHPLFPERETCSGGRATPRACWCP
jgi:hypothetical protein